MAKKILPIPTRPTPASNGNPAAPRGAHAPRVSFFARSRKTLNPPGAAALYLHPFPGQPRCGTKAQIAEVRSAAAPERFKWRARRPPRHAGRVCSTIPWDPYASLLGGIGVNHGLILLGCLFDPGEPLPHGKRRLDAFLNRHPADPIDLCPQRGLRAGAAAGTVLFWTGRLHSPNLLPKPGCSKPRKAFWK